MAEPSRRYFETLTELIQTVLDEITLKRTDFNPKRSIYEIHGALGKFQIRIKEIFSQSGRMYSYYVILENSVCVGFDNYPDARMLQLKYGKEFRNYLSELIPHKHGQNKERSELSDEIFIEVFLDYVKKEFIDKGRYKCNR